FSTRRRVTTFGHDGHFASVESVAESFSDRSARGGVAESWTGKYRVFLPLPVVLIRPDALSAARCFLTVDFRRPVFSTISATPMPGVWVMQSATICTLAAPVSRLA